MLFNNVSLRLKKIENFVNKNEDLDDRLKSYHGFLMLLNNDGFGAALS
jgi:hypothetical protein